MTINLTAPDPEFKYKLAVPHAAIVPASSPAERRRDEADPGHGRLLLRVVQPEQAAGAWCATRTSSSGRKPRSRPGYPDQITQSFGLTVEAQITAIENGQADWTLEAPPADRLGEIGTKYAEQVHVNPLTAFWYVPMNTNLAPFNNVKARQAVNYAIDRNAAVKLFGGPKLATPSCQVLPPGFPGHVDYCPYTKNPGAKWSAPDLAKAKQLVKESGTAGQKVAVVIAGRRGQQGDGRLPPERAQPDRLQGDA